MDTNFLKAHAERCRSLAENADEFTKRRLLNLAAHYDKRLAGAGPSVDQGYDGLGNTLDTTAAAPSVALATDSGLAGDGITKDGTVNIAGLEAGATWQYASALAITGVNLPNGASIKDSSGVAANLAGAVKTFTGLQISTTSTTPTTPTTPPSIAPTLSIADDSLWVAGRGGTVDLGLSVSTTDPNDAVTVNIRGLPKYETITDNLDGHTFRGKNITLTAAQVDSGLTLQSNYSGSDQPVATLTVTATGTDPVTNAVTTSAPQTITVVDPLPATAPTTGATPAVIVNIKTDFGAACNGIDSDYAAFQAFNAWALQWQQSHSGLIELDIPPGSICMFSQSGEGSWFAKGIKQLLVKGYGATLSDDNGVGGFVLGGGGIKSGNGGFGYTDSWTARAATVSAGSDSITLLDPSRTSIFSVGTWALMTGLDLMGYGYPPNPQFFEYVQITAINPTTGQVTFAAPLKNSYESTWPNYSSGTPGLQPDQGGPATLYALDPSWDTEVEYDGLTINQAGQIYANGRSVTFKDCNFNDGAEIPSQNMTWTIQNVNMPNSMIEVDKLVTTMNVTGGTLHALAFQSASVDTLNMNGTTVSSFMNGTPKTAYLSNDNIANLAVGAYAYGASSEVSITNSVLGSITAYGVYENGNGSGVQTEYSMSNGVITSPNTNGPLRWAVPGSTVIWSGQYGWEGEFKVLDVTQDANNTYVRTTMSDGFPSLGTVLALRVDPAVKFTSINNTGSPEALSLSQAPAGAPLYSYSNHTYSGNFGKAPSFEQWGELVSIKIDVIKPYTGSKSSLDMEVLGQFGPFVLDPDGSISRIDPTINLKVAGERYITSTSVTGLQPGDNISAPGPVSFTGSLNAFMGLNGTLADISSDDPSTWPIVSIEIVTDQGYGGLGNTLDTTAAAPSVALATDSGLAGHGITRIGTVNVTGLETGATWQYSVNGGSFVTGSGTSVTLTGDGPKAVLVHQTDAAGNISADAGLNFTLDTTAAAPSVALATDSGLAGDGITKIGTVDVAGLEAGATWQYAVNGGSFITGTGASFTLTGDGPKAVLVHQTDAAGNVSADASLSFTLDTIAATPAIALATDSGLAGDGITNIGTVDVAGLEAGATWQYAVNGGSFITGTGASFTLTGDGPKAVLVHQTDAAGNVSADASLSFTLQISTTSTTPTTPTTPPSIAPTLSIADDSLWVAGRGGTVDLGLSVSTTDPNDAVTVNIRGLPKYETITDNLDGHTFRGKNITLTAAQVDSGLTLQSNYRGSDQPVATLTVTATGTDPVTNAVTTSAPQTITVVDPPPATAPTRASLVSQGFAQQQHADPVTSTLATTAPQPISVTDDLPAAAASTGFLANQGFALLQEHMDSVRSTLATTAPQAITFADHLPATGATTASRASQSFALLNQYLASNSGRVDPGQIVAAVSQGAGWGRDSFLTRPQH